ncbi:MAG: NUDIX domain-containing protein [Firmicutes bacterium]|nr:NUDIX domain-containing protein [Bacillota bacterium]
MSNLPVEQRAGGVVFRKENGRIEFLLVTSNSNPNRWIIPAGHVEDGETFIDAALREVAEEAGVEAIVVASLGNLSYRWYRNDQKILINTSLYLMKYLQTITINPEGRLVNFFTVEETIDLNLWDESREFLQKALRQTKKILLNT